MVLKKKTKNFLIACHSELYFVAKSVEESNCLLEIENNLHF